MGKDIFPTITLPPKSSVASDAGGVELFKCIFIPIIMIEVIKGFVPLIFSNGTYSLLLLSKMNLLCCFSFTLPISSKDCLTPDL